MISSKEESENLDRQLGVVRALFCELFQKEILAPLVAGVINEMIFVEQYKELLKQRGWKS